MKILLIDDDRDLVDLLRYAFRRDGYDVAIAFDGEAGLYTFQRESPDLVVLDLSMPKRTGMEVLQEIRQHSQTSVIMLTGAGDEEQMVEALRAGADDYVVKPFRPRELRARVEAVLRRTQDRDRAPVKLSAAITRSEITLDPQRREVTVAGQAVALTRTEFSLLEFLMLNADVVVPVSDLLANVWGYDSNDNEDVVKVTISRLRRKIEVDPSNPRLIVTVPGQGYMLRERRPIP